MKEKLSFSGHDKFHCRQFWLKKGIDHVKNGHSFNNDAVTNLGVGRNMVTSIRYWIHAFGLVEENAPSELAVKLLSDGGYDPYLEDLGSVWLLHYSLVTHKMASLYWYTFNEFLRGKIEFNKESLALFFKNLCANQGTLNNDITVFINNYLLPEKSKGIEADFSGLLYELNLITRIERSGGWFKIENTERPSLAPQIILFCILKNLDEDVRTFSFRDLLQNDNSVGRVFCLSENGLNEKLQELISLYPENIVFSKNAGVKVLQIKGKINCWNVLNDYYGN